MPIPPARLLSTVTRMFPTNSSVGVINTTLMDFQHLELTDPYTLGAVIAIGDSPDRQDPNANVLPPVIVELADHAVHRPIPADALLLLDDIAPEDMTEFRFAYHSARVTFAQQHACDVFLVATHGGHTRIADEADRISSTIDTDSDTIRTNLVNGLRELVWRINMKTSKRQIRRATDDRDFVRLPRALFDTIQTHIASYYSQVSWFATAPPQVQVPPEYLPVNTPPLYPAFTAFAQTLDLTPSSSTLPDQQDPSNPDNEPNPDDADDRKHPPPPLPTPTILAPLPKSIQQSVDTTSLPDNPAILPHRNDIAAVATQLRRVIFIDDELSEAADDDKTLLLAYGLYLIGVVSCTSSTHTNMQAYPDARFSGPNGENRWWSITKSECSHYDDAYNLIRSHFKRTVPSGTKFRGSDFTNSLIAGLTTLTSAAVGALQPTFMDSLSDTKHADKPTPDLAYKLLTGRPPFKFAATAINDILAETDTDPLPVLTQWFHGHDYWRHVNRRHLPSPGPRRSKASGTTSTIPKPPIPSPNKKTPPQHRATRTNPEPPVPAAPTGPAPITASVPRKSSLPQRATATIPAPTPDPSNPTPLPTLPVDPVPISLDPVTTAVTQLTISPELLTRLQKDRSPPGHSRHRPFRHYPSRPGTYLEFLDWGLLTPDNLRAYRHVVITVPCITDAYLPVPTHDCYVIPDTSQPISHIDDIDQLWQATTLSDPDLFPAFCDAVWARVRLPVTDPPAPALPQQIDDPLIPGRIQVYPFAWHQWTDVPYPEYRRWALRSLFNFEFYTKQLLADDFSHDTPPPSTWTGRMPNDADEIFVNHLLKQSYYDGSDRNDTLSQYCDDQWILRQPARHKKRHRAWQRAVDAETAVPIPAVEPPPPTIPTEVLVPAPAPTTTTIVPPPLAPPSTLPPPRTASHSHPSDDSSNSSTSKHDRPHPTAKRPPSRSSSSASPSKQPRLH